MSILIVVALLGLTFLPSPVMAPPTTTLYTIEVKGDVRTVNAGGDNATFSAEGNKKGTKIHEHGVFIFLNLTGINVTKNPNFACEEEGVDLLEGEDFDQQLDEAQWEFWFLFLQEGHLRMGFTLIVTCAAGFDRYVLNIEFTDPDEKSGTGVYDSDSATIRVQHYAQKDKDPFPPGPRRLSHGPFVVFSTTTGQITVTVT